MKTFYQRSRWRAFAFRVVLGGLLLWGNHAQADPLISSWMTTYSGKYARIYTNDTTKLSGSSVTTWSNQTTPAYCGISTILSSPNWVYIKTTGLGSHVMGPWYGNAAHTVAFGGGYPRNQKATYRFPRSSSVTPSKTTTDLGAIGYFVDGVSMFDTQDGQKWTGAAESPMGTGYWYRDAYINEGVTFDPAFAHQPESAQYHYHANPIGLRYLLGDHVDYSPTTKAYSESTNLMVQHSPILGWVRDGFPIYGPYGYSNASSGAADHAEGYAAWDYNTNNAGGTGLGPVAYLEGLSGGIYLDSSTRKIDGNSSFAIYSSTGGQAVCRSILQPMDMGILTFSARFDVDNASGFSGFNLKSAQGNTFGTGELVAFGLNTSSGNNQIAVYGSTALTIDLGSSGLGSVIDFYLRYNTSAGTYTLGAKFRSSSAYTFVSGALKNTGFLASYLGAGNFNSGSNQNLIFDSIRLSVASSTAATNGLRRMLSGYVIRDGSNGTDNLNSGRTYLPAWAARAYNVGTNAQSGPAVSTTYPLGRYMEDKSYLGDLIKSGATRYQQGVDYDLDECNGRFCVTPEFPEGTYAYFVAINANGSVAFPYNIGRTYFGAPTGTATNSISETVTTNTLAGPLSTSLSVLTPAVNPNSGNVTLTWSSTEGGTYKVEASRDLSSTNNWGILTNGVAAAAGTVLTSLMETGAANSYSRSFYRVTQTGLAAYDGQSTTNSVTGVGIVSISPTSASRGTTFTLTINLDASLNPPPPPQNAPINSVTVGSITGANNVHVSQTQVTSVVTIPANSATGSQIVSLVFPGPPENPTATVTYTFTGLNIN